MCGDRPVSETPVLLRILTFGPAIPLSRSRRKIRLFVAPIELLTFEVNNGRHATDQSGVRGLPGIKSGPQSSRRSSNEAKLAVLNEPEYAIDN